MEPGKKGAAPPRAVTLLDLPGELILEHLSSTRDLGRAGCVCRAWRAGDSPVERVLRQRVKARGGAVCAALPPVAEQRPPMTHRLCLLELIGEAQAASGVMSLADRASAAVETRGDAARGEYIYNYISDLLLLQYCDAHTYDTVDSTVRTAR